MKNDYTLEDIIIYYSDYYTDTRETNAPAPEELTAEALGEMFDTFNYWMSFPGCAARPIETGRAVVQDWIENYLIHSCPGKED